MRWNCPHCGTALSVPKEKLTASWSFSKCAPCGGYSLVRRSDLNMIRIDQAPPKGQEVLQVGPQTTAEAAALKTQIPSHYPMMDQTATKNLEEAYRRFAASKAAKAAEIKIAEDEKPAIIPSLRKAIAQVTRPAALETQTKTATASPLPTPSTPKPAEQFLREALAQQPRHQFEQTVSLQVQTNAQSFTYAQAQTQSQFQAQAYVQAPQIEPSAIQTMAAAITPPPFNRPIPQPQILIEAPLSNFQTDSSDLFSIPSPLPEVPETETASRFIPLAIAVFSLIAVSSGIFLYQQGQRVNQRAQTRDRVGSAQSAPKAPNEWLKQKTPEAAPGAKALDLRAPSPSVVSTKQKPAAVPVPPAASVAPAPSIAKRELQQIQKQEVAEAKTLPGELPPARGLVVQVKSRKAYLRSGPGIGFEVLGTAAFEGNFLVQEWQGQWFRIALPKMGDEEQRTAWIRNDLVRLVTLD